MYFDLLEFLAPVVFIAQLIVLILILKKIGGISVGYTWRQICFALSSLLLIGYFIFAGGNIIEMQGSYNYYGYQRGYDVFECYDILDKDINELFYEDGLSDNEINAKLTAEERIACKNELEAKELEAEKKRTMTVIIKIIYYGVIFLILWIISYILYKKESDANVGDDK